MKEEEENGERVAKVQIEEIEVEEDETKDKREETKVTPGEENIVYIFGDEGVDEEIVLDSESTEQGKTRMGLWYPTLGHKPPPPFDHPKMFMKC